jgi:hypothetical protein
LLLVLADDEDHSYDPEIIGGEAGIEWLGDIYCLGFNSTTERLVCDLPAIPAI